MLVKYFHLNHWHSCGGDVGINLPRNFFYVNACLVNTFYQPLSIINIILPNKLNTPPPRTKS